MWPIEARNAAIANTYFVGANNRVGTVSCTTVVKSLFVCLVVWCHGNYVHDEESGGQWSHKISCY